MKIKYIIVFGVAVIASACGNTVSNSTAKSNPIGTPVASTAATPLTTPSPSAVPAADVEQAYLVDTGPAEAAYKTWHADVTSSGLTAAGILALAPQASTYATELGSFDTQITNIGASGKAETDIAILKSDDNIVIADLNALAGQTTTTVVAWGAKAIADGETAVAADNTVRADLGLPSV